MSGGVYLASTGLACVLGNDMPGALDALRRGGVPPTPVSIAKGNGWPVYKLPPQEGNWLERVRRTVRNVVAQTGEWGARTAPLFVASSSLDIGYMEYAKPDLRLGGDLQDFATIVSEALDWRGPVFTISTACTSALNAVLAAADLIREIGRAHV